MPYFQDTKECEEIMGGFFTMMFEKYKEKDETATKIIDALKDNGLVITFVWTDPEVTITLSPTDDAFGVFINDDTIKPVTTFSLTADTAHEFWHGKIKLARALTTKQIVAKGPIPKILRLLPIIEPLYGEYPKYLEEIGRSDLILKT
jgi:hypothetical protein